MAYRLCTFDSVGRITSVSPISYPDTLELVPSIITMNPGLYSFVDEASLTATETNAARAEDSNYLAGYNNKSTEDYDPTVEVTLDLEDPTHYISYGDRLMQDMTQAKAVYNSSDDPSTKPKHSSTTKKFGPTSVKFTKSLSGFTGGSIQINNISKTTYAGGHTSPHNNVAVALVPSYAMEFFFYPTSSSSNYTLLQKGPTGASANWKLGYDSSAGFLQFAWKSYGNTSGYNYSQNIVATAGLTLNTWHHVAVALVKNGATSGSYQMSGYFNGANAFSLGVTTSTVPETRFSNKMYLGNNSIGTEAFDGYIDSFRVLESGVTSGIFGPTGYGFLPFGGGTLGVPTLYGFTNNAETCFLMNFNGTVDSSQFYAESTEYVYGTAMSVSNFNIGTGPIQRIGAQIGVKNIVLYTRGVTGGATGYSDPTGFTMNYGDIVSPYINTAITGSAPLHGYDYVFALNSVFDNNINLNVYRRNYTMDVKYTNAIDLLLTIEGIAGNRGSSGNIYAPIYGTNPFGRLFGPGAGNCYGVSMNHNSLFLNPADQNVMQYIMENGSLVSQGISFASYTFVDAYGYTRNITATDIANLRLDILGHQAKIKNSNKVAINTIKTAATINEIKLGKIRKPTGTTTPTTDFLASENQSI